MNTGSDSMDRTLIKSGTSLQGTRQHHADLNAQLMEQDAKRGDTLSRDMLRLNDQWEIAKQKYSAMRKGQTNREAIENLKAMVAMFKQVHGDASKAAAALAMNGSSNAATEMVDEMGTYIPQMEKTIQEQMAHLETLGGNRGTVTQENEAPGTKTDPVIPTGPAGGPRGTGGDEEAKRAQPTPKLVPRKMPFGGDRPAPPSVKPGEAKKPAAPTSKPPAAGQTDVKVSSEKKQKILDAMGL
jgi:hypothetical protein